MDYGLAIKYTRVKVLKMQAKDLAMELGVSPEHYSYLENGHKQPTTNFMNKLGLYAKLPVPVMLFFGMNDAGIEETKKEAYLGLKHDIDKRIQEFIGY